MVPVCMSQSCMFMLNDQASDMASFGHDYRMLSLLRDPGSSNPFPTLSIPSFTYGSRLQMLLERLTGVVTRPRVPALAHSVRSSSWKASFCVHLMIAGSAFCIVCTVSRCAVICGASEAFFGFDPLYTENHQFIYSNCAAKLMPVGKIVQ